MKVLALSGWAVVIALLSMVVGYLMGWDDGQKWVRR